ncbi:MAG: hypothetical protein IT276_12210 [Ignavibacteriaceae bacterium]|nr:hypothetical protein [Ignavibacterium sp.]MCC6255670.1 hypothetical protein [Ignavibacteriaceae bacterium]HMN25469.1 hypothetical protein [Ignavibacteriaceae bacterium]HRN25321.1 hypothetical protein [Ignavibacteriaceae bacterium]HRP91630.1 hypothetical protein [Ignavibacteriaceae bacterium]
MIEGNKNSDNEDLSAFADYLAEFDSIVSFDNETCGVCGVSISDTLSVQKSPFVQFKSLKEESEILVIAKELQLKGIPFKIEKQLDSSILNEINYYYNILIPFMCLNELEKIKV